MFSAEPNCREVNVVRCVDVGTHPTTFVLWCCGKLAVNMHKRTHIGKAALRGAHADCSCRSNATHSREAHVQLWRCACAACICSTTFYALAKVLSSSIAWLLGDKVRWTRCIPSGWLRKWWTANVSYVNHATKLLSWPMGGHKHHHLQSLR